VIRRCCIAAVVVVASSAAPARAQVVGSFSWQTQPYCNVVTVTIVQQGGLYQLTGADDLCGAGTAPVSGTALPTAAGVVLGFTTVLPDGSAAHLSATVGVADGSGTWFDGAGHSGPFALNGGAAGAARPAPAIDVAQLSPAIYAGSGAAATVARSDHDHDGRYYTEAEVDVKLAAKAGLGEVLVLRTPPALDFVPEARLVNVPFTTTRAGRLEVQATTTFTSAVCATGAPYAYLLVNGVPVMSSVQPIQPAATTIAVLRGSTTTVVPAGAYQLTVAIDCSATGTLSSIAYGGVLASSVVVHP